MNQMNIMDNPFLGTAYQQPKQARMTQVLTPEQIKMLRTNNDAFTLSVSQQDMLRSRCTHKVDGKFATQKNADGTVTCLICGETFELFNEETEAVDSAVDCVVNILQSIKTYYVDMPDAVAIEFFQIIPFIKKIPKLYDIALKNFNAYDGATNMGNTGSTYGFNMLNQLVSPNMVINPMQNMGYGNYGMNMGYQQPQPMMNQGMPMMDMNNGANPFASPGYGMGNNMGSPNQHSVPMGVDNSINNITAQPQTQNPATGNQQQTVQTKVFNV